MMSLNKVSHSRFKEELERGFDILTNDPLKGPEASRTVYLPKSNQPRGVWTRALQTVNSEFMTPEEKAIVQAEEERKFKESQQDFYETQTEKLKQRQTYDPLASTNFARRSQRVMKEY